MMSRDSVMHSRGACRSTQDHQQAYGQKRTHRICSNQLVGWQTVPARGGLGRCRSNALGRPFPQGAPVSRSFKSTRACAHVQGAAPPISATSRVSRASPCENPAGKDSPNTKYRSRSALLQERASKLLSGSGEMTTRVEPAMIGCEA
jgi:hypothetical protein